MKINGCELVMALPIFEGSKITQYVILVNRGTATDPYVTARVRTLDDAEWWAGQYFSDLDAATASVQERVLNS